MLVTTQQMRDLEVLSVEQGATWAGLMAQAGHGVADHALTMLHGDQQNVVILVGAGNNGGDGLVAARHLLEHDHHVTLYVWKRKPNDADWSWHAAQLLNLPTVWAHDDPNQAQLQALLAQADIVIDGLLGVGVNRLVSDDLAAIINVVNQRHVPVLAIDVPSGLDADSGKIWGTVIHATMTVATGLYKRGHFLYPGAAHVGVLALAPIDLPHTVEFPMANELNRETLRALVPARPVDGHKDTFGRVMIVAGSYFYPGAAVLAARSAARSGVGVVTLACPRSIFGSSVVNLPEATYLPLPEGEIGALNEAAAMTILEKLGKYKAMLVGCGLGTEEGTADFLKMLIGITPAKRKFGVGFLPSHEEETPKRKMGVGFGVARSTEEKASKDSEKSSEPFHLPPLVLDADALNLLAQTDNWWEKLSDLEVVITPHVGEMARLFKVEKLDDDHPTIALDAAKSWGVTVVLKAAHTVIASPNGDLTIHSAANPALATAGSGDVLAGLLAGLLAQGMKPFDAAQLAVGVHSIAGAIARDELGERGVIAGDLIARLPQAWKNIEHRT